MNEELVKQLRRLAPMCRGQVEIYIEKAADEIERLERERDALIAKNEALRKGLNAVAALINDSHGVTGLHLNGDIAPWDELRTGGRFEDWLIDFDNAMDEGSGK
jgi:hypothetical protein